MRTIIASILITLSLAASIAAPAAAYQGSYLEKLDKEGRGGQSGLVSKPLDLQPSGFGRRTR